MASSSESSNSTKETLPFASLSEILKASKRQNLKPTTRSSTTLLPSLEDLQKKLDGNKESCSKLNFSRAFGLGSLDFENSVNHEGKSNLTLSASVNTTLLNYKLNDGRNSIEKSTRQNRRLENKIKHESHLNVSAFVHKTEHSINDDTHREIVHIINQIEKNKYLNFDEDDKECITNKDCPTSEFNMIQLPYDFKLDNGHVNVYQSGIIEIVSGDDPPVIYRLKNVTHNRNNLTTDLVITNDSQAYLDQMNVCIPATLEIDQQ